MLYHILRAAAYGNHRRNNIPLHGDKLLMVDVITETKPETTDTTKDTRVRHYVERLSPKGVVPVVYSEFALCGKKMSEVLFTHNGEVCQACVDKAKHIPVEK